MLFSQVALDKAIPYACEDADITLMAYDVLNPKLKELGLDELMTTVEMPLVPVLLEMETDGIALDTAILGEMSLSLVSKGNTAWPSSKKMRYQLSGVARRRAFFRQIKVTVV